jgi:hypothetical protein
MWAKTICPGSRFATSSSSGSEDAVFIGLTSNLNRFVQ